MAEGKQFCFAAFMAFLLIVIDQSAAKCIQPTTIPAAGNDLIDSLFFRLTNYYKAPVLRLRLRACGTLSAGRWGHGVLGVLTFLKN
jgi:hypothetical protein